MLSVTHHEVGLTDQNVIEMYRYMLLAREIDKRTWLLNRAGKIPFVVSSQGHEATQVGAAFALDRSQDLLCPYYRDLGMVLVYGMTAVDIMMSNFGKPLDPNSRGRQMPGHYGSKKLGIFTGSSPVTTQVPHAVGIALAARLRKEPSVVLTCFGEGSSNQGDFHEGLNFAGVHQLPVIFLCQNNGYAISTPLSKQVGGGSIAARASGYGIQGEAVDGNDIFAVYSLVKKARERALNNEGPTLIEAFTYRLTPHTSDDDDSVYRSKEEVEQAWAADALLSLADYLADNNIFSRLEQDELLAATLKIVDDATAAAEAAEFDPPESLFDHVYGSSEVE